mmetsp:Transcript_39149/g.90778  ORF Transcript_39149/g.90778 Transcript_39149/m.90778 type:complete len:439 (-) Transcript_39149:507-1823(-)
MLVALETLQSPSGPSPVLPRALAWRWARSFESRWGIQLLPSCLRSHRRPRWQEAGRWTCRATRRLQAWRALQDPAADLPMRQQYSALVRRPAALWGGLEPAGILSLKFGLVWDVAFGLILVLCLILLLSLILVLRLPLLQGLVLAVALRLILDHGLKLIQSIDLRLAPLSFQTAARLLLGLDDLLSFVNLSGSRALSSPLLLLLHNLHLLGHKRGLMRRTHLSFALLCFPACALLFFGLDESLGFLLPELDFPLNVCNLQAANSLHPIRDFGIVLVSLPLDHNLHLVLEVEVFFNMHRCQAAGSLRLILDHNFGLVRNVHFCLTLCCLQAASHLPMRFQVRGAMAACFYRRLNLATTLSWTSNCGFAASNLPRCFQIRGAVAFHFHSKLSLATSALRAAIGKTPAWPTGHATAGALAPLTSTSAHCRLDFRRRHAAHL